MKIIRKLIFWLGLAGVAAIAISALMSIWNMQTQAENDIRYFQDAFDPVPEDIAIVNWASVNGDGRSIDEPSQRKIALDYTNLWRAFAQSNETRNLAHIEQYFTGSALTRALHSAEANIRDETKNHASHMVFLGMDADAALFSLDRSVIQIRAENALFARFAIENDQLVHFELSQDCILSNLLLKTTGWHLSDHRRDCANPVRLAARDMPALPKLKGINYYPRETPWTLFWTNYDEKTTRADIAHIQALGANSVRIFLPYEQFLRKEQTGLPDHVTDPFRALEDFLAQTREAGLLVVPTLFDFRGELNTWNWSNDRAYLQNLLPLLSRHDHIAYIDLKNELDLDFYILGEAHSLAWAQSMLGIAHIIAPELRYSIGWSNPKFAPFMADAFDVISYHDYGELETTMPSYRAIKAQHENKPVIVSEIGASSYALAFGRPSSDEAQARDLRTRLNALADSDGAFVWTLHDFPALDPKAVGGSFWHRGIQKHFGLLSETDSPKPAYQEFQNWSLK